MRVFLGSESISWTRRISDNLVVSPYLKQKRRNVLWTDGRARQM